jgi:hypothetical protein
MEFGDNHLSGRGRRWAALGMAASIGVAAVVAASEWRPQAQTSLTGPPDAVRLVGQKPPLQPGAEEDRGATYYWLEGQASRVTTRFVDAIAVAERLPDGDFRARVTDLAGNEMATLMGDVGAGANTVVELHVPGGARVRAEGRPGLRPTLDWSNRQAYSFWRDLKGPEAPALEWQTDLMRPRGAPVRDVESAIVDLRTEWADGVAATARRDSRARRNVLTGRPARGAVAFSRLVRDNVEVGLTRWYAEEKVFSWSLPGLTMGYVDEPRLKEAGGWTFTPDLAWLNVQAFAFQRFHPAGQSARVGGGTPAEIRARMAGARSAGLTGRLEKALGSLMPTLYANEPGCDGLHWLDRTTFRPCCDSHDRCYEKYGCSYRSWWLVWSSWRCDMCNLAVVFCFATGGWPPYQQSPY